MENKRYRKEFKEFDISIKASEDYYSKRPLLELEIDTNNYKLKEKLINDIETIIECALISDCCYYSDYSYYLIQTYNIKRKTNRPLNEKDAIKAYNLICEYIDRLEEIEKITE